MTPVDPDAYVGLPTLFSMSGYDEVHISVAFTWDIERANRLKREWEPYCGKVLIGGPALGDPGGDFYPGKYLKHGAVITSRGCPNKCGFCFVPKREGKIRELFINDGNNVLDNNLLACSRSHIDKVFAMLKTQKGVIFSGGIESDLVTNEIVDKFRGLSIKFIWLAYDHKFLTNSVFEAIRRLRKHFTIEQIRCYVLIGYQNDSLSYAKERLSDVFREGALPFAMLYRDEKNTPTTKEWRKLQKLWARPAFIKAEMKGNI